MARLHTIYTYRTGNVYRYAIRSCNNHTNSLGNGKFSSRSGRNAAVRKLVGPDKDNPKYLVEKGIPPKKGKK